MPDILCSKCQHPNPTGARFCAGCGQPLFQAAPSPPPPQQPNLHINLGSTTTGSTRTVELPMSANDAVGVVQAALTTTQGEVTSNNGTSGTFTIKHSKFSMTWGRKITLDGTFAIVPTSSAASRLTLSVACKLNALMLSFIGILVGGVILCFTMPMAYVLLIIAVSILWLWYYYTHQVPEELLTKLLGQVKASTIVAAPKVQDGIVPAGPFPQPAQGPAVVKETVSPAPANETDAFEMLRKLRALRDADVITVEEFEAKKAEYMARI